MHCVACICADGDLFVAPKFVPTTEIAIPPLVGLFLNGLGVEVILGASNVNSTVGLPISHGPIAFAALIMPGLHPLPRAADGALFEASASLNEAGETKQDRLVGEAHVEEAQFTRM